jgi:uncharacterized Zn finger protein
MDKNSLTVKCPNCGEIIELAVIKVPKLSASIEGVEEAIKEWIDQVDVTRSDDSIVITPKEFLGKKLWYQINNALEKFGAEWVSAGKESRWIIES